MCDVMNDATAPTFTHRKLIPFPKLSVVYHSRNNLSIMVYPTINQSFEL